MNLRSKIGRKTMNVKSTEWRTRRRITRCPISRLGTPRIRFSLRKIWCGRLSKENVSRFLDNWDDEWAFETLTQDYYDDDEQFLVFQRCGRLGRISTKILHIFIPIHYKMQMKNVFQETEKTIN